MACAAARAAAGRSRRGARRCDGRGVWESVDVGSDSSPAVLVHMKPIRRGAIIAVGSEMLTPSKIDTNSLFITEQLNLLGVQLAFKSVVGDDRGDLEAAVREALARVDLLVCCGGLGPTDADLTRPGAGGGLPRP